MDYTITNTMLNVPLLPMREEVIFPGMTAPFYIGRKQSMAALEEALQSDKQIFVVAQKDRVVENPSMEDLYSVGVLGTILQSVRLPNGTLKALFQGEKRARLIDVDSDSDAYGGKISILNPSEYDPDKLAQLAKQVRKLVVKYIKEHKESNGINLENMLKTDDDQLADKIAPLVTDTVQGKQTLLEIINPVERLQRVYEELLRETEVREIEKQLKSRTKESMGSSHKDEFLNEQLHSIQNELGQGEDGKDDIDKWEKLIKEAKMPSAANDVATKELKKLMGMSAMSAEANVIRNYLDWLVALPWHSPKNEDYDLDQAQHILDEDHYGLEKIKERIIEFIAVAKMKKSLKGPILCFVGPPGVGKTSLAKSIARALGKEFARMSLGGIRDESEIRGHRRTYIGAMPGKIIQSMKKVKTNSPVVLMDEIDKLYASVMGDPSAALLEVLDPEQNTTFMDHYIEVEYDLSKVLFICTANSTARISAPLLDRMEVINLAGYTELEKVNIARSHLVKKQLIEHGLSNEAFVLQKSALAEIIRGYTREAGVRTLEKEIAKIMRKVVTNLAREKDQSQKNEPFSITTKSLQKYLGVPTFRQHDLDKDEQVGLTVGLGVFHGGGELLVTEVQTMKGKGKLSLTGSLGDVLKESAQLALSCVRSRAAELGILPSMLKQIDIHIHMPENAMPKDGPSAGASLVVALVSALTGIPIRTGIAMTGELTLHGRLLEIGGINAKLLAAKRHQIKTVLLPKRNEKDLAEIPEEVRKKLEIVLVSNLQEILSHTLTAPLMPIDGATIEADLAKLWKMNQPTPPQSVNMPLPQTTEMA